MSVAWELFTLLAATRTMRDVVGGVQADEHIVHQHDGRAEAKADEGILAERAHEEDVSSDGE